MLRKAKVDLEGVWRAHKGGERAMHRNRVGPDGRSIPHVCIKAPTGGDKTRIAGAILKRMRKKHGLVLWMAPTTPIMDQTVAILKDKEHPIRRMLDAVSGNATEIGAFPSTASQTCFEWRSRS